MNTINPLFPALTALAEIIQRKKVPRPTLGNDFVGKLLAEIRRSPEKFTLNPTGCPRLAKDPKASSRNPSSPANFLAGLMKIRDFINDVIHNQLQAPVAKYISNNKATDPVVSNS